MHNGAPLRYKYVYITVQVRSSLFKTIHLIVPIDYRGKLARCVLSLSSECGSGMWSLPDYKNSFFLLRSSSKYSCEVVFSVWGGYGEGQLKSKNSVKLTRL